MKRIFVFFLLLFICSPYVTGDFTAWAAEATIEDLLDDDFLEDDEWEEEEIYDPFEPMNRFFFEVNDKLYYWVIKPTNRVYSAILPGDIRGCFANFFYNLATPVSFLNNILQGDFEDAGIVLSRFMINSTLGIFGFGDPAYSEFHLAPRPADFGQTLGKYGIGEGPYLYWPVLGPSNARDLLGYITDTYTHPVPYFSDKILEELLYYSANKLNLISLNPDAYDDMKKFSLDPYVAVRQAYHDYRQAHIRDDLSQELSLDDF